MAWLRAATEFLKDARKSEHSTKSRSLLQVVLLQDVWRFLFLSPAVKELGCKHPQLSSLAVRHAASRGIRTATLNQDGKKGVCFGFFCDFVFVSLVILSHISLFLISIRIFKTFFFVPSCASYFVLLLVSRLSLTQSSRLFL